MSKINAVEEKRALLIYDHLNHFEETKFYEIWH